MIRDRLAGRAGTVARAFQGGGKSDWSLPSKDELNQMYIQRSAIGGFVAGYYWSSSEASSQYNASEVWSQNFKDGYQDTVFKGGGRPVRPVRAF
jgi:hypothetical protein